MHSVGIQGALAIKRQRKRRDEQKRAKERRYSIQSSESGDTLHSPHGSTRRHRRGQHGNEPTMLDTKVVTSIGMLHIGVVFVVFGTFLIGAGILPDDMSTFNIFAAETWFNELVFTGVFAVGMGAFLIVLNSFISKQEDNDLEAYVHRQLHRSRSGHRLERDVETGVLTTRHTRRTQAMEKDLSQSNIITPITSELVSPTTPMATTVGSMIEETPSSENLLEQILEEDSSMCDDRNQIVSPTSNDKKCLLGNGHTMHSVAITRI